MRIAILVFVSLLFLASGPSFAGNNTLIVNYPAVQGVYSKIILSSKPVDCTQSQNYGSLFLYTDANQNQTLELCASNGTTVTVPYHETCFNRFCSGNSSCVSSLGCPSGYTQANINSSQYDNFSPDGTIQTYSFVCCDTGSGDTASAVLPT